MSLRSAICCFCFVSHGLCVADELEFRQAGQLKGELEGVSESGVITLRSASATAPLRLKRDQLLALRLSAAAPPVWPAGALVTLRNGDQLPVNPLSWSQDVLKVSTAWGAELPIERAHLEYLQWGPRQNTELYRGPQASDWQLAENWKYDAGLVAYGWGAASHHFDVMPESWILALDLTWDGTVNFQMVVGSEAALPDETSTAYVLMFHGGGLELKKRQRGQARLLSLAPLSDFTPDFFRGKVHLELRFDRQQRLLQLSANGVMLRRCVIDPEESGPVPAGSWLSLMTNAGQEDRHAVKNVQLLSWDRRFEEAQREKRKSGELDWLFDAESNRISGTWKSLSTVAGEVCVDWENPQQPQVLQVPMSRVAMVVFAGKSQRGEKDGYRVTLHHGGRLQVRDLRLENRQFLVTHPLLGAIRMPQEWVESMELQQREPQQEP